MFKYIAVDFDGTILKSNHKISTPLIKYFQKLQDQGIKVIPASGRNLSQMMSYIKLFNDLKYDTFIISDNGGTIHELKDGNLTLIRTVEFDETEMLFLNNVLSNKTKDFLVFKNSIGHYNSLSLKQRFISVKFGRNVKKGKVNRASKVLMIDKQEFIADIYPKTKMLIHLALPNVNVFRSVPTLIEVTPNGATKGQALQHIFNLQNLDISELIAFGDGENDIDMLQIAGRGVAMKNGFDTVTSIADDICKINDEDGVFQYLHHIYS